MQLVHLPTYSDFFDDDPPSIESLLKGISSHATISMLAYINNIIYIERNELSVQIEILREITKRQSHEVRTQIIDRLIEFKRKSGEHSIKIFSTTVNIEFVHYELINFRNIGFIEPTIEQELLFFKAYLLFTRDINDNYSKNHGGKVKSQLDHYRNFFWPLLVGQVESESYIHPTPGIIKSLAFLNFLQYHAGYSDYVKNFLTINEKDSSWNYVLDLAGLVVSKLRTKGSGMFSLKETEGFQNLFRSYLINPDRYREMYSLNKQNYSGIKSNPLIKYNEDTSIVINWNYIALKLHEGLKFDFYYTSGINTIDKFAKLPDYFNFIAKDLTEKTLFRKLIENILGGKKGVLLFDDKEDDKIFPDAYFRSGKHIFIIEIKDSLFSSSSIDSYDYKKIKETIDIKYNSNSKGTGQIVKQLGLLALNPFEKASYKKLGLKQKNLVIYPIMIYTDRVFGMSGVSSYLQEELNDKVLANGLSSHFQKVQPLSFISMDFLIEYSAVLHRKPVLFKEILDYHIHKLNTRAKKFFKTDEYLDLFKMADNFEDVIKDKYGIDRNDSNFIDIIVNILNLKEGLPSNINNED